MRRLEIDILGISEVRWPISGKLTTDSGALYYSGRTYTSYRYGTDILVNKQTDKSIKECMLFNNRFALLKLQTTHIIQIYAPTNDKSDTEVKEFYKR